MKLTVAYRISNGSYQKNRLPHATKEHCLRNFIEVFKEFNQFYDSRLILFMDNCNAETANMILQVLPVQMEPNIWWGVVKINGGSSAQSFNRTLDYVMKMGLGDDDCVYFLEDDYLHKPFALTILKQGLERAQYVSLYDHPDKYTNEEDGGNPYVEDGGEVTRVFRTESCHWKLTNSTTMTFAVHFPILKADEPVWRKYTEGTYPQDFHAFMQLRYISRTLATPLPGYSTHTEVDWLSPYTNWSKI